MDDDPIICGVVGSVLAAGYDVHFAPSVDAAQLLLQSIEFALVLCDQQIGAERGSDLHAWLQAQANRHAGRMLFMSGDTDAEALQHLRAGDVLLKPFRARELLDAISNRLSRPDPAAPS